MLDFLKNIGPTELIIVVIILLVIFGTKVMTGLARTGGRTVKELKKVKKEFTKAMDDEDDKPGKKG